MSARESVPVRRLGVASLAAAASAVLVAGFVSPAAANESGQTPLVGAFALGDALEGMISERDGAFEFGVSAGPLPLRWESRTQADRSGLGPGWGFGFGNLDTLGGVRVARAAGGPYDADPSHPTGLAGYGVHDARFEQSPGVLEARDDRAAPVPYEYALHELGGVVTYFDASGDPVVQVGATGQRLDWDWDAAVPHRLLGMVDPDGVELRLDWESEPGQVLVHPGANLPPEPGDGPGGSVPPPWRIEHDGGRVSRVVDPLGGTVDIAYDASGLVSRITGASGASTVVAWQGFGDGVARIDSVRTVDPEGSELSVRSWAPGSDARLSSGWPAFGGDAAVFWSGDPGYRYTTVVGDGATRVESEYNSVHELVVRRMVVSTQGGEVVAREQTLEYPGTAEGGVPSPHALPGNWSRPVRSEFTLRDVAGRSRTVSESLAFDDLGRTIDRTSVDGTRTVTTWDRELPGGRPLPVGLQTEETVIAPDGLISRTVHTLNDARTAVVATETSEGREGSEPVVTSRVEYDVEEDGFVTEQRWFPADEDGPPTRTRWGKRIDLAAGTTTATETVAAGLAAEATTTQVVSLRHGGVLAATGPSGLEATSTYDALGRVVEERDPAGNRTRTRYEDQARDGRTAVTVATADGVERTEIQDPLGRVVRITDNIRDGIAVPGHVRLAERREYPEPGVTRVTDAWGATTTARQDVFGRAVRTDAPNGLAQVAEHDDVANTVTTGLSTTGELRDAEQTTTERLDVAGRAVGSSGIRRDGEPTLTTERVLDGFGRPTTATDGVLTTTTRFDDRGRPAQTTLAPARAASNESSPTERPPDGRGRPIVAEQRFDGFGSRTEKILGDGDGDWTRSGGVQAFDALDRVVSETDQLGRITTIAYTVDGLVELVEHGSGRRTELTYDPDTRDLVGVDRSAPGTEPVRVRYRYDPVTGLLLESFDPADRAATSIMTRYDAFGSPTQVTYPDGAVVSYEYDPHGRRIAVVDVEGNRTEYSYDATGALTRVVQRAPDGRTLAEASYDFDDFGRMAKLEHGNGVTTEYTFTSTGQIATESTSLRGAAQAERRYEYDARGNLVGRADTVFDGAGVSTRTSTRYTYDAYDRLTGSTVHRDDGTDTVALRSTTYELSPSGDIRRETVTARPTADGTGADPDAGSVVTIREFEYSPLGEVSATVRTEPGGATTRVEQQYDAAGNLIVAGDGTTFSYDAANRPITRRDVDGGGHDVQYWADGTRRAVVERSSAGEQLGTTTFRWDGDTVLNDAQRVEAGSTREQTATYLVGAARHARSVSSADDVVTSYLGADRHGSVTELTDAAGAVTTRYDYTDYGVRTVSHLDPTAEETNPFGYSGEYTDPDGTQHLAVRTYDPHSMRFTTMDTAGLHNRYAYAGLNPITRVDPSGRIPEQDRYRLQLSFAVIGLSFIAISWMISPPVGMLALVTTMGFMTGDLLSASVAMLEMTLPERLSGEDRRVLGQVEIGIGVVIGVAFVFGLLRLTTVVVEASARSTTIAAAVNRVRYGAPDYERLSEDAAAFLRVADPVRFWANFDRRHVVATIFGMQKALHERNFDNPVFRILSSTTKRDFWTAFQERVRVNFYNSEVRAWTEVRLPPEVVDVIRTWTYRGTQRALAGALELRDLGARLLHHPPLKSVPGGPFRQDRVDQALRSLKSAVEFRQHHPLPGLTDPPRRVGAHIPDERTSLMPNTDVLTVQ